MDTNLFCTQVQIWRPDQHHQDVAFANAEEKRAIYYFREKAAPVLAGSLDSSFWNRLVLQVGDSEPAVRLAIMAVGSLFEYMQHEASGMTVKHLSLAAGTNSRSSATIKP
jgi:hypothetical protein